MLKSLAKVDPNESADFQEFKPQIKTLNNGILIIVPEVPPKVDIFERSFITKKSINTKPYQYVRSMWYLSISKAVEGKEVEKCDPAEVWISYYVPCKCDTSNFLKKIIVDALMYSGVIGDDDNFERVNPVIEDAQLCPEFPRTEIIVKRKCEGEVNSLRKQFMIEAGVPKSHI